MFFFFELIAILSPSSLSSRGTQRSSYLTGLSSRRGRAGANDVQTIFTILGSDPPPLTIASRFTAVYYITEGDINFIKRAPLARGRSTAVSQLPPVFPGQPRPAEEKKKTATRTNGLSRATRVRNPARHERLDVSFPVRRASNAREGRASVL